MSKKTKTTYSLAERRGYWMGVGISNAVHDQRDLLDHPDRRIRESVRAGYEANNREDLSHRTFSRAKSAPAKSGTLPPWVKTKNGGKKK